MKSIGKKLLSFVMVLALMVGFAPGISMPVYASDAAINISNSNASGTHWSYDASTHTLTLEGYSYSGSEIAVDAPNSGVLTINLVGENTINSTNSSTGAIASRDGCGGGFKFTGTGSLTVTAPFGIYSDKSIEIVSGDISFICDNVGIYCDEHVTVSGGEVHATGTNNCGVYTKNGGKLSITGGKLVATGGNGAIKQDNSPDGVLNSIAGTGWTDTEGTEGKADIPISTEGQTLTYKKVQFPADPDAGGTATEYAALVNTTTAVRFNDMDWYIIADESTAADAGTVTLLAKEPIAAMPFLENGPTEWNNSSISYKYSTSTLKTYLDGLTGAGGSFAAVADAIVPTDLTDLTNEQVSGAKIYPPSSELKNLSSDVLKCTTATGSYNNKWWRRTKGNCNTSAGAVDGSAGTNGHDVPVGLSAGVRPALRLDLSKVVFSNNTFALPSPVASVTPSGGTATNYTDFSAALSAWTDGSTLTLLSDVTTGSTINVSGTKTLDLNGYGIKYTGGAGKTSSVITVGNGANLTLNDSGSTTHYYTVDGDGLATVNDSGAQTYSFTGGYITGANTYGIGEGYGAVHVVSGGTFTMYGGTIIGNRAERGGGVQNNGNFTLNDGTITGNISHVHGGGVCTRDVNSRTIIAGGTITKNVARRFGGGLNISGPTEMSGGTISDNEIKPRDEQGQTGGGGGVYVDSSFTLTGGTISGNKAVNNTNKNNQLGGGGILIGNGQLTLSGNTVIKNNSGINGYDDLYVPTGKTIAIGGELSGESIGVTMQTPGVFTNSTNTSFNDASKFVSDNAGYAVFQNSSGQLELRVPPVASVTSVEMTEYTDFAAAVSAWNSAANDATLKLLSDVTTASTITVTGTKTLDLNGYGIRMTGNDGVINIGSGANLKLADSNPTAIHYVTLTNWLGTAVNSSGSEDAVNTQNGNGVVKVSGGYITGGNKTGIGGGIYAHDSGTFAMNGGTIIGNCSVGAYPGAGMAVESGANVTLSGNAKITYNRTQDWGGAILFSGGESGVLTIKDNAVIQYNNGQSGIHYNNGTLNLSGSPVIKENIASQIGKGILVQSSKITVNGELNAGADIHVYVYNYLNDAVFTNTGNTDYNDPSKFTSEIENYMVGKNADGQLILGEPVTVTFNTDGGSAVDTQTVVSGSVIAQPADPTKEHYTFGGWYTDSGLTNAFDFNTAVNANTTLYAKWTANQYTITFDTDGGSTIESITRDYNSTVTLPAAPTKADSSFAGWNTKADGSGTPYAPGASLTLTGNLTLYAQWTDKAVHTVSGKVTQGGAAASEVTLRLVQGGKKIAVTATNDDGAFSFSAPDGIYNIVAEKDGKTKTELVTLNAAQTVDIVLPTENVNSKLTVSGSEITNVMVGGLDELAEANSASGQAVTVSMTVEEKENAANKTDIETVAAQEHPNQSLDCIEIKIEKTVDSATTTMESTNKVLEIVVPYRFTGKENVEVYRYHDSAAKLNKLDSKPSDSYTDGTYYPDKANGLIYIYADKFSTYAIGYTQCYNITGPINYGSFNGTVTVSLLDGGTEKYTTTANLTDGAGAYSFTHVLEGTYTLRAVWTEDGKETALQEALNVW